jgi:hypothetical protein
MTISRPLTNKPNKIRNIISRIIKKNNELKKTILSLDNDYQVSKNDIIRLKEENIYLYESENKYRKFTFFLFIFSLLFVFSFLCIILFLF